MSSLRVGNGFDVHAFCDGRPLILGGIKIDYHKGLAGHSDADVLIHSIIDSLLGAAGIGDIGRLFPDSDSKFKDISSLILLREVFNILKKRSIRIINTDSVVVCEKPKISPYISEMQKILSHTLDGDVLPQAIGIKGTTSERLGFTGREEGIAVYTVSLIEL